MGWRALSEGRWPRLNLRARLARILTGPATEPFACPPWLKPDLIEQFDLPARWGAAHADKTARRCSHPEAHRVLTAPLLGDVLESYDPGRVGVPIEARHPLLDVRVVEYVLSLPPSPWCIDKELLRLAMRGRLPETVRLRPKAPLARDPVMELLQQDDARWVDTFEATSSLERYVDRSAVPPIAGTLDADRIWTDLRPLCLNFWLQHLSGSGRASGPEEYHEVA
jgi:asparagine synthase (glutamine-hydrolysing)